MSSNALVRKVTDDSRSRKKGRYSSSKMRVPMGLRKYIDSRGTPKGTYELTRNVTGGIAYTNTGMTIGAANYSAGAFVITPQSIILYSGVAGNSTTWNIPNYPEIAALWDKVKIDKVEFKFSSSVIGAANSGTQQPVFLFAEDDNDTSTSTDAIKQMDCKTWVPGNNSNGGEFSITIRPRFQRLNYYTSLLSSYEPARGYVVSDTAIPHYGLKIGIDPLNASGWLAFTAKVYFKAKELK